MVSGRSPIFISWSRNHFHRRSRLPDSLRPPTAPSDRPTTVHSWRPTQSDPLIATSAHTRPTQNHIGFLVNCSVKLFSLSLSLSVLYLRLGVTKFNFKNCQKLWAAGPFYGRSAYKTVILPVIFTCFPSDWLLGRLGRLSQSHSRIADCRPPDDPARAALESRLPGDPPNIFRLWTTLNQTIDFNLSCNA